jgi:hypothetical protein
LTKHALVEHAQAATRKLLVVDLAFVNRPALTSPHEDCNPPETSIAMHTSQLLGSKACMCTCSHPKLLVVDFAIAKNCHEVTFTTQKPATYQKPALQYTRYRGTKHMHVSMQHATAACSNR